MFHKFTSVWYMQELKAQMLSVRSTLSGQRLRCLMCNCKFEFHIRCHKWHL